MNWFKRAISTMSPLELDWNIIFKELEKELGREPDSGEIQERLMQKYWKITDYSGQNRPMEDIE